MFGGRKLKKIVFVMPKLGGGGAERVVATIIKYIDKNKFQCSLILFNGEGDYQNEVPKNVDVNILSKNSLISNSFELIKKIRKLNPDIVFSSMRSISALLGILKIFLPSKVNLVFRENNTPSASIKESRFPFIWKVIYKTVFKKANTIICQSEHMINDFKKEFNFSGKNLMKIYNPLDIEMIKSNSNRGNSPFPNSKYKNVVAIGKMTEQKGFDLLLKSFAKHDDKTKDIQLWILGEGKKYCEYQRLAVSLGINDRVHFVGRQRNPFLWLRYADLFILSSRYEGLPNVLLEALCCGCPVVTTDHPGGTKEVMDIIGYPDRIVELDWDEKWFYKMDGIMNILKKNFEASLVIKKFEKVFEAD